MKLRIESATVWLETLKKQIANWKRSFSLIWAASPVYTAAWAILLLVQGVLPGLLVYLTKLVVDNLLIAVESRGDWEKLRPALIYIAAAALVMMLSDAAQSLLETVRSVQADIVQDHVKSLVHSKCAALDMAHFESPEYHDRLEQATSDGVGRPLSLLESIGNLIQNAITLVVMAGLLVRYSVWLPLVLLVSTLPAFVIVLRYDRAYHRWWRSTTGDQRWTQYFNLLLTHRNAAAESKVFNLNPYFQTKYQTLRRRLRAEKFEQMRKLGVAKLFAGILSLGILGASIGWMGWRALHGWLTLGDLALFYQAFNRGQGLMRTLFGSLGQTIKNSLFLEVLFEFLDLKTSVAEPAAPALALDDLRRGIRFRSVTFRYPNTDKYIFRDFSFFIPAGKTVAMVGENGSGKTTLIKLICRFYDPESGSIEFDGVDIRNFSTADLLRMITVMFQMPIPYQATAGDSIKMGDLNAAPLAADVENAAASAGAADFISRLPKKYETLLGNVQAEGVELSGGEWQRLALARAYFRRAPVVLLDEPTSFMDSWSEIDWFDRFAEMVENRTSLIITHRFTIAMRADIVHVIERGAIIESGTHAELLAADGAYAKSWRAQMRVANDAPPQTVAADAAPSGSARLEEFTTSV